MTIQYSQDKLNNTLEIIWAWSRDLGKAVGTRRSTSNRKRTSCVTHSDVINVQQNPRFFPEITRYLSCKQPNMLRMFKRPTLKLWGVSPKLIFASDKSLLKLLLTAVPPRSVALKKYPSAKWTFNNWHRKIETAKLDKAPVPGKVLK